jgi:carbon-monoxide dehydrogenase small subunit
VKREQDFVVNGEAVSIVVDTRDTLLDLLRDRLGLTGTKEGCGNGNCGACTVLLDGAPVNACIVFALEAAGCDVKTIESVAAGGRLDRVQEALIEAGGTQCGFCTPGVVLSAKALLERNPHPSTHAIRAALAGNLCRCTGYDKIVEAVEAAAGARRNG